MEPIGGASAVEGATAPKVTIFTRTPLPRKFLPTHSSFCFQKGGTSRGGSVVKGSSPSSLIDHSIVCVEQPLASPGSSKNNNGTGKIAPSVKNVKG